MSKQHTLPLTLLLSILLSVSVNAQIFPIQVNPQLVPPYSPYLSDYTAPGAQKLMVQLRANDITISDYPCKLRISIEGVGIIIRTKPNFVPQPLMLQGGGIPQVLFGEDLAEYFHPDALDFSGLTRTTYQQHARLPEGLYRFTVEVLDYHRGTVVSNSGMAMAWIILNDPPFLNMPSNFSKLQIQDPTNILFSWTPRHSGSPNAAFTTEYTFRLIEIWPENRNPYDAFLTQLPLFETTTTQNQIVYGMSDPALIPGRKYAWQVEARDMDGRDLFRNKGHSEVFIFQFGEALSIPENFQLRWAKPTTLSMRWDPVLVDSEDVKYRLLYRPRRRQEDHQWYETRTQFTQKTLYHLQPNTEYEMKVRTESPARESAYTDIRIYKTLRSAEDAFVCKDLVDPPPTPPHTVPVFPLMVNDTLHAGGYDVIVRDVMEVNGRYYGSGVAIVPWFNAAKVRVTFEKIRVNDGFWLTSGTVKSVWNVGNRWLLQDETPILPGKVPEAGELNITVVAADSLITIAGAAIASVSSDEEGNIVVTTTDGKVQTLPQGESYAIADGAGNGYVIDKQGNIAKTTSTEAHAAAARGNRTYDLTFQFARGDGRYGFDEKRHESLSPYYQQLDDGSYVAWKALSSATADEIEGRLESGDFDIANINFRAGVTPVIPMSSGAGEVKLRLQGSMAGMEEELLALYSAADTLPEKVVGKINLVTYDPIHYNLEIVPVNGASLPPALGVGAISESLNKIFGQAVVKWHVNLPEGIPVDLAETFDDGETGVLSNYTADMKKVLDAWGRLRDNTYYLFLIEKPRNPATLGYMPRNRQAGFVFMDPHKGDAAELLKTIGHELGHGAFNLKHTFSEHNLALGTTDNVMDYSDGTALYKYQWDYIHAPRSVMGLFEGEEDGKNLNETILAARFENLQPLIESDEYKGWFEKFRKVIEFFKSCNNDEWKSYNGQGIIPWCFWKNQKISPKFYYTNVDLPFTSGIVDGAYLEAESFYHLPDVVRDITKAPGKVMYTYTLAYWECRTSKLISNIEEYEYVIAQLSENEKKGGLWSWVREQWYDYEGDREDLEGYFNDCRDAEDLREAIEDLYALINNWEEIKVLSGNVCRQLNQYWITLKSAENIGRYEKGKLVIPTASLLLPFGAGLATKVEKLKDALRLLNRTAADDWKKFVNRIDASINGRSVIALSLKPHIKSIYHDCIKAGYKATDKAGEIIFRNKENIVVAKISGDVLHIKIPYENGWATQSETFTAKNIFDKVKSSRKVYRLGTLKKSEASEAQYWSAENPFEYKNIWDYAEKYGIPKENLKGDHVFFEVGIIADNVPYITREAPAFGSSSGGAVEIVIPPKGVRVESFNMVNFEKQ